MVESTLPGTDLRVLQSTLLQSEVGVFHFCTLRNATDPADPYSGLNLCDYVNDDAERVHSARSRVATSLELPLERLWFPRQVHGTEISVVDLHTPQGLECDAVITTVPRLCIGISTADCVPILLYDRVQQHAVAAIHAGWRGTVQHIVSKTICRMHSQLNVDPAHLTAVVGPSISPEAFEVGWEVANAFHRDGFADCIHTGYTKPHIDLRQANVEELLNEGVPLEQIDCTPLCTRQNYERLFSARAQGVQSGRIASCIMLR
jgi:hypothetical protein